MKAEEVVYPDQPQPAADPGEVPLARQRVCIERVSYQGGAAQDPSARMALRPVLRVVEVGTVLDKDHEAVKRFPASFEKVTT